jgi:hypothetical protein
MREEIMAVYNKKDGFPLVFQPRIRHWYDVNYLTNTLPAKYQGMHLDEIYKDLEVSPREVWGPRTPGSEHAGYFSLKVQDSGNVEVWTRKMTGYQGKGTDEHIITEYRTPKGDLRQVQRLTEHGSSLMNVEYFLKNLDDLKVFEYILNERRYQWDNKRFQWGKRRFGEIIPLRANLERIPIMWLIVGLMGFKRTVTMIWKNPNEMNSFMKVLENEHIKQIDVYKGKPVDELNFVDNMHQDLCPPPYFKDFVIPFFKRVIPEVHKQSIVATSHWDGYVKQLIPLVKLTGLDGLECVTPLPQGDVALNEMKEGMQGMFLRDGIPAVLMCPWSNIKTLKNHVESLIEAFYPRLILGISDLLPANADIKRVNIVNEILKEFNSEL